MKTETLAINPRICFYELGPVILLFHKKRLKTVCPTFEFQVGFLAQAGGLIGACLGFSFISLVELVYWLVIIEFIKTRQCI